MVTRHTKSSNGLPAIVEDSGGPRDSNGAYSVRSLVRGLQILKCFDVDQPEWGLMELSKRTGLHKATCYRLLRTLEAEGFLGYDPLSGRYHLGPSLLKTGYLARANSELVRIAHPHLEKLATFTGETVDLAVWVGDGVLFIDQVLTSHPFKPASSVGRVFTDLGNAHTKVHLAFGPKSWQVRLLAQARKPLTPFTIAESDALLQELERVAREGIAYDLQEQAMGTCAVAAPVRDSTGQVRASISIVAPEERFGIGEMRKFAQDVRETATAISLDLGYLGDAPADATEGSVHV